METGGVLHDDFILADVLGVSYNGSHGIHPSYIAPPTDGDPLFGDYTRKYLFMIRETQTDVSLAGGEMLAEVVLPVCSTNDIM